MTKEEIIQMAIQAGFVDYELDDGTTDAFDKRYETFAKLVAEHECVRCVQKKQKELFTQFKPLRTFEQGSKNDTRRNH